MYASQINQQKQFISSYSKFDHIVQFQFILYSVMQSDRNTLEFIVVITKFLRRHYRIMGSEQKMKSMIDNKNKHVCCGFI